MASNAIQRYLAVAAVMAAIAVPLARAQDADLLTTKSGPAQAAPGTNVAYSVTLANLGPDDAAAVALNDPIPAGMTFVSASQTSGPTFACTTPAVGSGGTITCTIATLTAGASAGFTFTFNIPPATALGTSFTNVATATTATNDPNPENDSAVAVTSTPPPPQSDMFVTKTGPSTSAANTDVLFTISVGNSGPDPGTTVQWQDTLPGTMTFVSLVQNGGPPMACTTPAAGAGGTVTCTLAAFPAGATASFTLTVHIPPATPSGTEFTNTATVIAASDPTAENDSATHTVTVAASDPSVTKTGPAGVTAGANLSYTVTVANAGPDPADNVILNDPLPPATTFVSFAQNSGPVASCTTPPAGGTGNVTCSIATLPNGASAQFTLIVRAGNTTSVTNTATVSSSGTDTNPANNSSGVTTAVTPAADVSVAKSGPPTVSAGSNLTYTVTVTNSGPSDAATVALSDALPANTTFVSASQTSGPPFTCTTPAAGASGTIDCSIGTLAASSSASFTFVFRVDPAATGSIVNTANVSTATGDPAAGNNSSGTTAAVSSSADVSVTKSGPASVTAGSNVTYTVTVANGGPSNASTVSLSDVLPANTAFVSATQTSGPAFSCTTPAGGATGTINCTIATLTPGASASFTFVFSVSAAATGSITNTAGVSTATADPSTANNSSSTTAAVVANADLSVAKSGPATVTAGANATYTLTLANAGPANAASVTLTDVLPATTSFISMAQTSGPPMSCTTPVVDAGGTVTCTAASFAAGASAGFTLVLNISPAASGSITNTATVSAATADPSPADNSSSTTATVGMGADLSVAKSGPAAVTAGSNVTYTIAVANGGPSNAASVSLTDNLPAGTTFVSNTQTAGPPFACTTPAAGAAGTVTCTSASFAVGATATFSLVVNVSPGAAGTITNTASVTSSTGDPSTANNSSSVTTTVNAGPTDASIAKSVSGAPPYVAGSAVTYTVVVRNNGPGTAAGTVVTDTLPAGTTLVAATTTQGSCSGTSTVTCNVGDLAPGAKATITLAVTLPATPGSFTNTATVTITNTDTDAANNSSSVTITTVLASQIPLLSPLSLALLALMLTAAVFVVQRTQ